MQKKYKFTDEVKNASISLCGKKATKDKIEQISVKKMQPVFTDLFAR